MTTKLVSNPRPKNLPKLEGVDPVAKGSGSPKDSSMQPKSAHSTGPEIREAGIKNGASFGSVTKKSAQGGSLTTFTDSPKIKETAFTPKMNEDPAKTKMIAGSGKGTG
jgi:hypothetical protein